MCRRRFSHENRKRRLRIPHCARLLTWGVRDPYFLCREQPWTDDAPTNRNVPACHSFTLHGNASARFRRTHVGVPESSHWRILGSDHDQPHAPCPDPRSTSRGITRISKTRHVAGSLGVHEGPCKRRQEKAVIETEKIQPLMWLRIERSGVFIVRQAGFAG